MHNNNAFTLTHVFTACSQTGKERENYSGMNTYWYGILCHTRYDITETALGHDNWHDHKLDWWSWSMVRRCYSRDQLIACFKTNDGLCMMDCGYWLAVNENLKAVLYGICMYTSWRNDDSIGKLLTWLQCCHFIARNPTTKAKPNAAFLMSQGILYQGISRSSSRYHWFYCLESRTLFFILAVFGSVLGLLYILQPIVPSFDI